MALDIGNPDATSGMTQAIYQQIRDNLEPDMDDLDEEALAPIRDGWRKLAHAIATGVVNHLLDNLEIRDIETRGNIDATVDGDTGAANGHQHSAGDLRGRQNGVTFRQSNSGTRLIK